MLMCSNNWMFDVGDWRVGAASGTVGGGEARGGGTVARGADKHAPIFVDNDKPAQRRFLVAGGKVTRN
jgi:hypothetical protein